MHTAAQHLTNALKHLDLFVKPAVQPGMVDAETYTSIVRQIEDARHAVVLAAAELDAEADAARHGSYLHQHAGLRLIDVATKLAPLS